MSAASDAHLDSMKDQEKNNKLHLLHHGGGGGHRHLLGDKSPMGWHEAKTAKRAAKHSRWADWIRSKFARKQAVKEAVHEHVADAAGRAADWVKSKHDRRRAAKAAVRDHVADHMQNKGWNSHKNKGWKN